MEGSLRDLISQSQSASQPPVRSPLPTPTPKGDSREKKVRKELRFGDNLENDDDDLEATQTQTQTQSQSQSYMEFAPARQDEAQVDKVLDNQGADGSRKGKGMTEAEIDAAFPILNINVSDPIMQQRAYLRNKNKEWKEENKVVFRSMQLLEEHGMLVDEET
jgi:hypothetical protein